MCDLSEESDLKFIENYKMIRNEILDYDIKVSEKEEIIVLSKSDLVTEKLFKEGLTCLKNSLILKLDIYLVIKILD